MTYTPNSIIYLCKTKLENNYKHQLTFSNKSSQLSYFNSTIQKSYSDFTYVKKDNVIYVNENIDAIIQCNYLFYKNKDYTDRYYYCFITDMQYQNENCTKISFETDVFQTWQFDINYHKCFVEREHVNNDTIGLHTVNENLSIGEVVQETEIKDASFSQFFHIAISTTYNPAETDESKKQFSGVQMYNKQIFGNKVYIIKGDLSMISNLYYFILDTVSQGHISDIREIFIIPSLAVDETKIVQITGNISSHSYYFYELNQSDEIITINDTISKLHSFSDFTPKNNKCYVYPYNYLYVTNNVGNSNIYKYEDFYSDDVEFQYQYAISVGGSCRFVPKNYKKIGFNQDEAIPLAKFPTCGWSGDAYVNWLTQNAVNMPTSIANTALSFFGGLKDGKNFVGTLTNTLNSVASTYDSFYQAQLLPSISRINSYF